MDCTEDPHVVSREVLPTPLFNEIRFYGRPSDLRYHLQIYFVKKLLFSGV